MIVNNSQDYVIDYMLLYFNKTSYNYWWYFIQKWGIASQTYHLESTGSMQSQ